ncbi:hypothetical protein ACW9KT_19855 [Hymenobacter sp. HD11105]
MCLTDEEYDCIQRQVSPAYHPIPVYREALAGLGRGSYATSNRR